ncbi:MAG: V-type ATP synthase subunit D [Candidatus Aerophobetes bacterium]|nr:V-type ATP synthase subunit D [Candidatus Aerophobetes bacterium]
MSPVVQINPTRMELLKQKQRLGVAKRAHDLLEDKRDKLIKEFLPLIKEVRTLREEVRKNLNRIYADFQLAKMINSEREIEESLMWPTVKTGIEIEGYSLLRTPRFKLVKEGDILCYGFYESNWKLDSALNSFFELLPSLIQLAQKEGELKQLAKEIERTRRRVNALEYIFIPQIEEAVEYITMKLEERERAHIINLMKIKEMLEGS